MLVGNQLDILDCKIRFIMVIFFQAFLIVVSGFKLCGVFCIKRRQGGKCSSSCAKP